MYQLEPNSTYVFQVWANNRLGRGEITEVEALTKHDSQEIGKDCNSSSYLHQSAATINQISIHSVSELAKHLLEGAETFDTRVWVAAVAIVMGTLLVLATATIYALYRECRIPLTTSGYQSLKKNLRFLTLWFDGGVFF